MAVRAGVTANTRHPDDLMHVTRLLDLIEQEVGYVGAADRSTSARHVAVGNEVLLGEGTIG
jgi:hypothetical protein